MKHILFLWDSHGGQLPRFLASCTHWTARNNKTIVAHGTLEIIIKIPYVKNSIDI